MDVVEGWYDDGQREGKYRWWDGEKWTGFYSDVAAAIARGEQPSGGPVPPMPGSRQPDGQAVLPSRNPDPDPDVAVSGVETPTRGFEPPRPYRFAASGGWPNVDIVGEAHHEAEIVAALGRRPGLNEEIEVQVDATLVPEPDNPHDANAVSVRVGAASWAILQRTSLSSTNLSWIG